MCELMGEDTGAPPVMWGPSNVGFGTLHYTRTTGRQGARMNVGFSPRRAALSLYGLRAPDTIGLLPDLGPHTSGVACVYVARLEDFDERVPRRLVALAFARGDFCT